MSTIFLAGQAVNPVTGALQVKIVSDAPSDATLKNGRAYDPVSGALYIISNGDTSTAVYNNGEAISNKGAVYTVDSLPANGVFTDGVLHSPNGERFVATSGSNGNSLAGITVYSIGSMLIESI